MDGGSRWASVAAQQPGVRVDFSNSDSGSGLSQYFSKIRAFPSLTREQEHGLAERTRTGCLASRDKLISANLSFVVKVASE
jgi:DNA-directed RNA polymerase sigma subunit (sigma70/sigma32)